MHNPGGPDYYPTWRDLDNKPGSGLYYPKIQDLHLGVGLGVLMVILRYLLEIFVIIPMGHKLGVRRKKHVYVEPYEKLEAVYGKKSKMDGDAIHALSKQLDLSTRQIEVWFRKKRKNDAPVPIKKFCDNTWLFLFYSCSFIYGINVMWSKPWLWKTKECWYDWPVQPVTDDVFWYYQLEVAFYWGSLFTLFTDHKRKDFIVMTLHDLSTLALLYFSWMVNLVRIGTLVLVIHDAADPWLSLAKMGIYLHNKTLADLTFIVFALLWFTTRCFLFPYLVILWTCLEIFAQVFAFIDEPFFVYYFLNAFLLVIQLLNIMWTFSVVKIMYNIITKGEVFSLVSSAL
ncbi:hypothetical protein DPMN_160976 [Dreissena polymorpha]|uniref:Uncharacterized protein n=1 Tax=Dreissena polymorpha TaxID=45954 RepID=A0A9D4IS57_DREPO|nr:hypothetical protein DPMN_160976 [Dreissena polymorpha]